MSEQKEKAFYHLACVTFFQNILVRKRKCIVVNISAVLEWLELVVTLFFIFFSISLLVLVLLHTMYKYHMLNSCNMLCRRFLLLSSLSSRTPYIYALIFKRQCEYILIFHESFQSRHFPVVKFLFYLDKILRKKSKCKLLVTYRTTKVLLLVMN